MLFEPFRIGNLELDNRLMRSATCDWISDNAGLVTDRQAELYAELGAGGIGLIVSGHIYVRADGIASSGMTGADRDECVTGLTAMAAAVHRTGRAKIAAQLNHGGRSARMCFGKCDLAAPSPVPLDDKSPVPRDLTTAEVEALAKAYGDAARRVKAAGFDAVQIHGAHGYLVSQFLSPLTNKREDAFGGTLENRSRFLKTVYGHIRAAVGDAMPVMIKLGAFDGDAGGLTLEEGLQVGRWFAEWGGDAIEVSGGINAASSAMRIKAGKNEAPFLDKAAAFKHALSIPVITVNGYRSLAFMEKVLASGKADMIALCRPFIREPDLALALVQGTKTTADCISCNRCFKTADTGLRCPAKEKAAKKDR